MSGAQVTRAREARHGYRHASASSSNKALGNTMTNRDPLDTNTDAVIEDEIDEAMPVPSDEETVKAKRNYFAIYHDATLLEAVENARGTESANAFLTRLICNALQVPVPERKTRRRFSSKEEAQAVREVEAQASEEATRILRQKEEYAQLLAEAMKALES